MQLKVINNYLVRILYNPVSSSPAASAMSTTGDLNVHFFIFYCPTSCYAENISQGKCSSLMRPVQMPAASKEHLPSGTSETCNIFNISCMEAQRRGSNTCLSSTHSVQDRHIQVTPVFPDSGRYWCCSLETTRTETDCKFDGKKKVPACNPQGQVLATRRPLVSL